MKLILKLRDYYKTSPSYKNIYNKDSFQDWDKAIGVLSEWSVLSKNVEGTYRELGLIRQQSIHFTNLSDLEGKAHQALSKNLKVVNALFGPGEDICSWRATFLSKWRRKTTLW